MRSLRWVRFMAGLAAAALLLAPARPAAADAGGGDWVQTVDGYDVHLAFPEGLARGVMPVQVRLTDEHGVPVAEAQVQVVQSILGALTTDAHGDAGADDHAEDDAHSETSADDHSADSAHPEEDAHSAELEPADDHSTAGADDHSSDAADPHSEAEPHTHDTSVLFQLTAGVEPGTYTGTVIFFETGQYAIHINFAAGGQEHTTEFAVAVPPPDRGRWVLAAFVGLNVAIIGAAAVIKRKSAAA